MTQPIRMLVRTYKEDGTLVLVFPEEPGTGENCKCYYDGEICDIDYTSVMTETRPTGFDQYLDFQEVTSQMWESDFIGLDMCEIVTELTPAMRLTRQMRS